MVEPGGASKLIINGPGFETCSCKFNVELCFSSFINDKTNKSHIRRW